MSEEAPIDNSMAALKNRSNDRKAFCILYLSVMAASSIAVSVQAMDESKDGLTAVVHDMLLGTLYATSTGILFGMIIYFFASKRETFEAAKESTGPISFIVKYSICGEPVNMYLRLGLAMFSLMSIGQNGVRIASIASTPSHHWPEVYKSAFEMSFFICQTSFILIFHRIVILHNNELFGACLIHVLSTNLSMWADVTVEKIRSTLHIDNGFNAHGNHNDTHDVLPTKDLSFYLLPAVSEYCLLSAALIYEITVRIGEPSYIELDELPHLQESKKQRVKLWLNKIKSGYWSPILIVFMVVVLAIVTGVAPKYEKVSYWKCAVLFTEEMFLNCLGIFVSLAAFLKLRRLKFTIALRKSVIDEFLLYIAFFFTANYLVATIALTSYMKRETSIEIQEQDLLMGRLALDVLELVEVLLQTYLIQDCFRRCSEEEIQQRLKPGRQMIAVLLGINLASWVVKSFQLKEADVLYSMTDYTPYGWVLIAIAMPVYLFYRYHCTVCLSEAFTMLYEDETRRFEILWRQNPIYLANLLSNTNLAFCENCHLHAGENVNSHYDGGSDRLTEVLQRKMSTQSFQLESIFPRRSSFFHPQGLTLTNANSLHDIDAYLAEHQHPGAAAASYKLSVPCNHKKMSVPSLKRLSLVNVQHNNPQQHAKHSLHAPLPESESFEGPNYFLSHENGNSSGGGGGGGGGVVGIYSPQSKCIEHSTQTGLYAHDNSRAPKTEASKQFTHHLKHYPHSKISGASHQQVMVPPQSLPEIDGDIGDRMQRRQTLVNLETAKFRYLAAEMAHKRVLDRSAIADTSLPSTAGVKKSKRTNTNDSGSNSNGGRKLAKVSNPAMLMKIKKGVAPVPPSPNLPPGPVRKVSPEKPFAAPVNSLVILPPQPPEDLVPSRGLEPSKVLPLLIAANLAQSKDTVLTSVPEESHEQRISEISSESGTSPEGGDGGSSETMHTPIGPWGVLNIGDKNSISSSDVPALLTEENKRASTSTNTDAFDSSPSCSDDIITTDA